MNKIIINGFAICFFLKKEEWKEYVIIIDSKKYVTFVVIGVSLSPPIPMGDRCEVVYICKCLKPMSCMGRTRPNKQNLFKVI